MKRWTPADENYLRVHYANVDTAQLSRLLGRDAGLIVAHANRLGLHKHYRSDDLKAVALMLAARPHGMKAAELGQGDAGARLCGQMVRRGSLFSVTLSHRNVRYFAALPQADTWRNTNAKPASVTFKRAPNRAWWRADAPEHYPPNYKFTQCPSPQLGLRTGWGCGINALGL